MLKKSITYTDYNGVERTEDFWFNLSKAEIMEMEMSTTGGLAELIKKIVQVQDAPAIIKIFKDLILKAYGEKSADGKHFMKEDENGRPLADMFKQTGSVLKSFHGISSGCGMRPAKLVNGIIPADAAESQNKAIASGK